MLLNRITHTNTQSERGTYLVLVGIIRVTIHYNVREEHNQPNKPT